jgi:prevent-host-death family protein
MKIQTVTATEANRSFSKLLRAVERGERVEITSHGRKVARLEPLEDEASIRQRQLAGLERLKARWATQKHITVGPWTRDELYERD